MDKGYGIGAGNQLEAARQLEVHAALDEQYRNIERAEHAVAELIGRIEPLLRKEDANSAGAPTRDYSSDLAAQLGKSNDRIDGLANRLGRIISRLEI
jgi:hypothetical protein